MEHELNNLTIPLIISVSSMQVFTVKKGKNIHSVPTVLVSIFLVSRGKERKRESRAKRGHDLSNF